MVRRTKDAALETRISLLDTAVQVFSERGVSRTSLADIAEAAGVTRGAIYWHFQDKAELFCEMVARVTLPMEGASCQINHAEADDPLASIRSMMIGILERTLESPQARRVFHILFHKCEYVDEMTPVWNRLREMRAGCLRRLEQGLKAAVARGQLPAGLDTRHAAAGLNGMVDGLISLWVIDTDSMPRAREAECIVDLFLNGLRHTPAAKKKTAAPRRAGGMRRGVSRSAKAAGNRAGRRNAR